MAIYEIITPRPGNAEYSLTGSMYIGGPPPVGHYTANSDGSLVGWWKLNESDAAPDATGRGNDGSSTSWPLSDVYTPSLLLQQRSNLFNGSTSFVDIGSAATWDGVIGNDTANGSTQRMTFSMWFRKTGMGSSSYPRIFQFGEDKSGPGFGGIWAYFSSTNTLRFGVGWSTKRAVWESVSNLIFDNQWYHLAIVYDATDVNARPVVYINGQQIYFTQYAGWKAAGSYEGISAPNCVIGNSPVAARPWQGQIADFAIWNKLLSPKDINAIYKCQTGPIYYSYRDFKKIGRGMRASPTGSVEWLRQGIDADTSQIYFGSMLPRVGSGDRFDWYRNGKRLPAKIFDDTTPVVRQSSMRVITGPAKSDTRPGVSVDMAPVKGERLEKRLSFDYENRSFGQPDMWQKGEPYADIRNFNPISYILDQDEVMWPVNLWNMGDLPGYEFDGVIEPLDIRREILGYMDGRYEGRAIRGALVGSAGEGPFGSREIADKWSTLDPGADHFLDAPDAFGTLPLQAYQDLQPTRDEPFIARDYQDIINGQLRLHNYPGGPTIWNAGSILNALMYMSGSSESTDPAEKRANHGFYFGQKAGSIVFGDK